MRYFKTYLLAAMLSTSSASWANSLNAVVTLKWIEPIKTEKHEGDELYISVLTEDMQKRKDTLQRIPEMPLHWLSRYAAKLQNITVWQASIESGDEKRISLQLTEANNPPFDPDDDLGVVDFSLQNNNGQLYLTVTKPTPLKAKLVTHYVELAETLALPKSDYRIMIAIENLSKEPNVVRRSH